jgi:hypothetical protein
MLTLSAGHKAQQSCKLEQKILKKFARVGHTQSIRMEETYTPMTMKPARTVIISDFFYIFNVFLKCTLYKEMPEDKKIVRMLIEEYL